MEVDGMAAGWWEDKQGVVHVHVGWGEGMNYSPSH